MKYSLEEITCVRVFETYFGIQINNLGRETVDLNIILPLHWVN